jgi:hypothetical protein
MDEVARYDTMLTQIYAVDERRQGLVAEQNGGD